MLIIFGGFPGTGKTTLSKIIAQRLKAVYLRVDSIEQALIHMDDYPDALIIGSEGYQISYAIARDNLALGLDVIADSVNPIAVTRRDWQEVAKKTQSDLWKLNSFAPMKTPTKQSGITCSRYRGPCPSYMASCFGPSL